MDKENNELNTDDKVSYLHTGFQSSCVANHQVFKEKI